MIAFRTHRDGHAVVLAVGEVEEVGGLAEGRVMGDVAADSVGGTRGLGLQDVGARARACVWGLEGREWSEGEGGQRGSGPSEEDRTLGRAWLLGPSQPPTLD